MQKKFRRRSTRPTKKPILDEAKDINFPATFLSLRQSFDNIDNKPDIGAYELRSVLEDINLNSSTLLDYIAYQIKIHEKSKK